MAVPNAVGLGSGSEAVLREQETPSDVASYDAQ